MTDAKQLDDGVCSERQVRNPIVDVSVEDRTPSSSTHYARGSSQISLEIGDSALGKDSERRMTSMDEGNRDTRERRGSIFGKLSTISTVWNSNDKNCLEKAAHTVLTIIRSEEMLVFDLFLSAGVSLYNLCTITSHSPPLFATVSIFAVSFTSFLAFQYCLLRIRNGRVVRNLVLVVRNWNHILQLIVVIILYACLSSDDNTIKSDYNGADGHRVHRHYHCTEVYYGINYTKSIYHFSLMMYALLLGELTMWAFLEYTGKYFFKTFFVNTIRKAAVSVVVGAPSMVSIGSGRGGAGVSAGNSSSGGGGGDDGGDGSGGSGDVDQGLGAGKGDEYNGGVVTNS